MSKRIFSLIILSIFITMIVSAGCSDEDATGPKTVNSICASDSECQTGKCYKQICAMKNARGAGGACFGKGECRSFNCSGGRCVAGTTKADDPCRYNEECKSNYCLYSKCAATAQPDKGFDAMDSGPDWYSIADWTPDITVPDLPLPDMPPADGGCTKDTDCDDYIDCTTNKCSSGKCTYTLDKGYCLINSKCLAAGKTNAKNACQKCDTKVATTKWSPNDGGSCDDNELCTYNDVCKSGKCTGTAYKCDDSLWCTQDACTGKGPGPQGCKATPFSNVCLIGITCYADKKVSTVNSCYKCDAQYQFAWTAVVGKGCVTTFAGDGSPGSNDGDAIKASFSGPAGLAIDSMGNLYIADTGNSSIRVLTQKTVAGKKKIEVATLLGKAGSGFKDGAVSKAMISKATDIAVDNKGFVYIADTGNHRIRVLNSGLVTTLAGSGLQGYLDAQDLSAKFNGPTGIAVDKKGTKVWVADAGNMAIREIVVAGGVVSTLKKGSKTKKPVVPPAAPYDIEYDGTNLYFTDSSALKLYKLTTTGTLTHLAGAGGKGGMLDGPALTAQFKSTLGLLVTSTKTFIADGGNNRIRTLTGTSVSTFAGAGTSGKRDDIALKAWLKSPSDMVIDKNGYVYIADTGNNVIRLYTP